MLDFHGISIAIIIINLRCVPKVMSLGKPIGCTKESHQSRDELVY